MIRFLVVMAAVGAVAPQTALAQGRAFEQASIDGIDLTEAELERYNAAVKARADALRNTKLFVEQAVEWIDNTAPGVIQTQQERLRVEQMRSDFIALGRRVLSELGAQRVTAAQIRTQTLRQAVEVAERELSVAEKYMQSLVANDVENQSQLDNATARIDLATAELDAAQAALDAWLASQGEG